MPNSKKHPDIAKKFVRSHEVVFQTILKKDIFAKLQWKVFCAFTGHVAQVKMSHDHYLKMASYVWTEDETEFFLKLIKERNYGNIRFQATEKCHNL